MSTINSYQDAIDFLNSCINYEAYKNPAQAEYKFSLDPIKELDAILNHPHQNLKIIHVAGTKGKGSVCMLLELYLRKAGFKTGLYTSPHLYNPNERIRINGTPLTDQEFTNAISSICKRIPENKQNISYFEAMTLAALFYFKEVATDYVILETGLGGRLDATNIVTPILSVLTKIDLDHTQILGNTHELIAKEKAGIIKQNIPIVALQQRADVVSIFQDFAQKNQTSLILANPKIRIESDKALNQAELENISIVRCVINQLQASNPNSPQLQNISLAEYNSLPGRYETFCFRNKNIMLDVAHNKISYERLIEKLTLLYPKKKWAIAFNSSRDKDLSEVIPMIRQNFSEIYILPVHNPRVYKPFELKEKIEPCIVFESLETGIKTILEEALVDIIVFTGSFYLVGEVGKYFRRTTNY